MWLQVWDPWESNVPPKHFFAPFLVSFQVLWACSLLLFDPFIPSVSNSCKKMAGPGGCWNRAPDLVIKQLDLIQYLIPLNPQHLL